jgi:hypothetical protein
MSSYYFLIAVNYKIYLINQIKLKLSRINIKIIRSFNPNITLKYNIDK